MKTVINYIFIISFISLFRLLFKMNIFIIPNFRDTNPENDTFTVKTEKNDQTLRTVIYWTRIPVVIYLLNYIITH